MKKIYILFVSLLAFSGCGIISKQYYYEPSVVHQSFRGHSSHSDYKMVYSRFKVTGKSGDSTGSIITSNGKGHPLLIGPLVPVIPVGEFFQKSDNRFVMEMTVNSSESGLMPLAVDSNQSKTANAPDAPANVAKQALQNNTCYMIVNDTLKIPLKVSRSLSDHNYSHTYWMTADIAFRKVNSLKLVTGNQMLDSTLKNITFIRRSRIKFDLVGPGY